MQRKEKRTRLTLWLTLPVLLGLLLTACSAPAAPSAANGRAGGAAPAAADKAPPTGASPGGAAGSPAGALATVPGSTDPALDRKLVFNADLSLQVKDARSAMNEIQNLINFHHGYTADANLTGSESDGWNAKLVLRIPTANYGTILDALRKLGEVRQQRQWAQDVTDQYIDLDARVKTLSEYEQRLRELALKANNFDDWLKLTHQINDTRIQVESLSGKLRLLSNQVEFSTINVSLIQPRPGAQPETASPLTQRMVKAFHDSAKALADLGEGLLVFLAAFLPVGIVMGAIIAAVFAAARGLRRRQAPTPPPPLPPAGGSV